MKNVLFDALKQLDASEISCFMDSHFDEQIQAGLDGILYVKEGSPIMIIFYISKPGSIRDIEIISDDKKLIEFIIEDAKSIITETGYKYWFEYLFTSVPVKGYYRFKDEIQIRESPVNNYYNLAKASYRHPFILEVRYKGSKNAQIDLFRRTKKLNDAFSLLNVLTRFDLYRYSEVTNLEWGYIDGEVKHIQIGFSITNFEYDNTKFMNVDNLEPIPLINNNEYLKMGNIRTFEEFFSLAEYTPQLLSKYFHQSSEKIKNSILNASYWLYQAKENSYKSFSLSIICLAASLESLIVNNKPKRCQECSQPMYELGKHFKDLLDSYFPSSINDDDHFEQIKSKFYSMRSSVVHGSRLLDIDKYGIHTFLPNSLNEKKNVDIYLIITKQILLKWFDNQFEQKNIQELPTPFWLRRKQPSKTIVTINP